MNIRKANSDDLKMVSNSDRHVSENELKNLICLQRIYIAEENEKFVGWLRYGLFWNNTPFLNMLYTFSPYRKKGVGKALVEHWEKDMKEENYHFVMTSTRSDEYAQHFYNKLGYIAVGGFNPEDGPYEVILSKKLQ